MASDGPVPSWPGDHDRPRVLVEAPGGSWHDEAAVRKAGFDVVICPGPTRGRRARCPLVEGHGCPLVRGADAVVFAMSRTDPKTGAVLDSLRAEPGVAVCVEGAPGETDDPAATGDAAGADGVTTFDRTARADEVIALLRELTSSKDRTPEDPENLKRDLKDLEPDPPQ